MNEVEVMQTQAANVWVEHRWEREDLKVTQLCTGTLLVAVG